MHMRYTLVIFCLLSLMGTGWAARRVDANAQARATMKRRRREASLTKRDEPRRSLDTRELLQLTEGESLKKLRQVKDAHGTNIERLQETYNGIEVLDSVIAVRTDEHGHLTGDASGTLIKETYNVNEVQERVIVVRTDEHGYLNSDALGSLIKDIDDDLPDTERILTDEETLHIALTKEGDTEEIDRIVDVSYKELVFLDTSDKARLANKVSYLIAGQKKPSFLIDLKNGEVLKHWNGFTTLSCCQEPQTKVQLIGGNEKSGKVFYDSQPYCLDFTVDDDNICYLENKYVRVIDMNFTSDESINMTASFPCNMSYGDAINGAYSPAIDVFFHGTVVGMMFEEWYGETALNDKIVIRVHYGYLYANAYWNEGLITLGDGDANWTYPFTNMDDVGHETGHGVVEQNSDLMYMGESGGINEAFADIMGETTEAYLLSSDFVSGQYVMKDEPHMREFERPENDGTSIGHVENMTEELDPHYSSGVYRRIWWVVVKEHNMDVRDTFSVFQYANQIYWHSLSNFYDASCGLLRAAMDLGFDTKPFAVAFEDVGIPKCSVSSHIFTVENNRTYRGIKVSETSKPVFRFSLPVWAKSLLVESLSPPDGSIGISLLKGSWEDEEYDKATEVEYGITQVEYFPTNNGTFESDPYEQYFIELSSYYPYDNVELTVGYICRERFEFDPSDMDFESRMMYYRACTWD